MTKTNTKIVGIHGEVGSGKDTVAKIMVLVYAGLSDSDIAIALDDPRLYRIYYATSPWRVRKFGDKLKRIAGTLIGIPHEKFEDRDFKNSVMLSQWFTSKPYIAGVVDVVHPITVRDFLKKIGDAFSKEVHPDTFVNALFSRFHPGSKWLIPDTRFKNEAAMIKAHDGVILSIISEVLPGSHISDRDLDGYGFDDYIDNSSSIQDLIGDVRAIMKKHNI